jgi:hypothetical protein
LAANIEELDIMPTASPHNIVKESYGSKDKLVEKVSSLVLPADGESSDDHKRRLRNVANRKLLHLLALGEKVEALGGRDGMVSKILAAKGQTKDHEYGDKLKKLSLGRLLDLHRSTERRVGGKAKKKPQGQRRAQ